MPTERSESSSTDEASRASLQSATSSPPRTTHKRKRTGENQALSVRDRARLFEGSPVTQTTGSRHVQPAPSRRTRRTPRRHRLPRTSNSKSPIFENPRPPSTPNTPPVKTSIHPVPPTSTNFAQPTSAQCRLPPTTANTNSRERLEGGRGQITRNEKEWKGSQDG